MNSGPFLLVKARNGLGNRLLCALTGLLYARLTHRQLVIDWSDPVYSSDGRNAFDLYFRCDLCPPGIVIPADASTRPAIWRGNLHEAAIDFHARVNPATLVNPTGSRAISVDLSHRLRGRCTDPDFVLRRDRSAAPTFQKTRPGAARAQHANDSHEATQRPLVAPAKRPAAR
jgi:hypothetical protein